MITSIYILQAKGSSSFGGFQKTLSKRCFLSREKAEQHVEEFKKRCTIPKSENDFGCMEEKHLRIQILELELDAY